MRRAEPWEQAWPVLVLQFLQSLQLGILNPNDVPFPICGVLDYFVEHRLIIVLRLGKWVRGDWPSTKNSQDWIEFFITHVPCAWLNGKHTVFGKVTSGLEVLDAIQQGDVMQTVVATES